MKTPDISIVIRTLNEELYLSKLLDTIARQKSNFSHEVILIDSGSSDNTLNIAREFSCKILHISRQEFSFGRSLNRACQSALGNYLIFISGHCIPTDNLWMQNLVQPLVSGVVKYVYGRQIGGPYTFWSESQIFDKYFPPTSQIPQVGFYCNNANSAIVKDVWSQFKFDEQLTGLEDMHLAKRLVLSQESIGYVAESCVYHLHHETWAQVKRRFEREALALQQICPEVAIRLRDFLRYFARAIVKDISTSGIKVFRKNHVFSIFAYRFYQYLGSYIGSRSQKMLSNQLRDSYFYPTHSKGYPLTLKKL